MADYCSCGVQLPPDARFCHKCGKPQREEPDLELVPETVEEPAAPVIAPPPLPELAMAEVTFHDRGALKSALFAAVIGMLLMMFLGLPTVVRLAAPVIAGFLSVFFYRRRTRNPVNLRNGLRLGWITGMLAFVISVVLFTMSVVLLASEPEAVGMLKEQMKGVANPAELDQMLQMLRTPAGILAWLLSTFLTLTGLPMIGGALGATLLGRQARD